MVAGRPEIDLAQLHDSREAGGRGAVWIIPRFDGDGFAYAHASVCRYTWVSRAWPGEGRFLHI